MRVRISTASSVVFIIEIDQEDAGDLATELDAVVSEQRDKSRWPCIRELEARLSEECDGEEEEEEEEQEEEEEECDCSDGGNFQPHTRHCAECGGLKRVKRGIARPKLKKKKAKTRR